MALCLAGSVIASWWRHAVLRPAGRHGCGWARAPAPCRPPAAASRSRRSPPPGRCRSAAYSRRPAATSVMTAVDRRGPAGVCTDERDTGCRWRGNVMEVSRPVPAGARSSPASRSESEWAAGRRRHPSPGCRRRRAAPTGPGAPGPAWSRRRRRSRAAAAASMSVFTPASGRLMLVTPCVGVDAVAADEREVGVHLAEHGGRERVDERVLQRAERAAGDDHGEAREWPVSSSSAMLRPLVMITTSVRSVRAARARAIGEGGGAHVEDHALAALHQRRRRARRSAAWG